MNKFSRIFHHIDIKDVKQKRLNELAIKKLEKEKKLLKEEKKLKEERILSRIADKKKFNWKNDLAESDWSPVTSTIANRATQTFQHISGTTATFAGLGGVEVHPSTTVITGETVSTPTYSDLALAGYAKPLGSLLRKKNKEDEEEINSRLDAGQEVARKANADVMMNARLSLDEWKTEQAIQLAWKLINKLPKNRFNQELKVLFGYLSGNFKGNITNKFIDKTHLRTLFKNATLRGDGRVQMKDFIVGSGQKLIYNPKNNTWGVSFNYDYAKNATELETSNVNWLKRTLGPILFGQYAFDASMFGPLVQHAKNMGRGQNIKGEFTFDADELSKLNPDLIRETLKQYSLGPYGSGAITDTRVWNPSMMGMPFGTGPVHNYYALTGHLPQGSVPQGSIPYNYGDHAEYDPKVIDKLKKIREGQKQTAEAPPPVPKFDHLGGYVIPEPKAPDNYDWRKDTVVRKKKVTKDT